MSRHTITAKEIEDYLDRDSWVLAASCGGLDSNKRLEASSKGLYRVTTHDKVTYQGQDLDVAVFSYNEAP